MMSLAADIGGTYSRLAWFGEGFSGHATEQVFSNREFAGLEDVIESGRQALGDASTAIADMVLALPGPLHRDPVELTNINWRLQRDALCDRFETRRLTLVNDFQAAALGAINEPYEDLKVLNPATPDEGPVVVAGVGTGLGMAWLAQRDQPELPHATEGGHIDFAPVDGRQLGLYEELAERYGHVSYERVLSGDGLVDTYRHIGGASAAAGSPAAIADRARAGDRHARDAIALFVTVFAAYAGNLALAFNPVGGIYLCGGLTAHLAEWFDPTSFALDYSRKGRMADVVRRVPVYLVRRHGTGLAGVILIARAQRRSRWA